MADTVSMEDFIFGTLATDDLRMKALIAERRGLACRRDVDSFDPEPGETVRIEITAGPDAPVDEVLIHYTTDGSIPEVDGVRTHTLREAAQRTEWDTLQWGYVRAFAAVLPGQPEGTTVRYRVSAMTKSGERIWANGGRTFSYPVDTQRVPAWANEAVIYQIFMDRFAPTPETNFATHGNLSDFYGGTLRGVTASLDYLTELGVNTLWLSPIFPSPTHHGYDATDFREINPRMGDRADFRELMEAAHGRGMRVILDFVPNHSSNEHPYFQSAQSDPQSPYRDFYTFTKWPDEYEAFFAVKTLPQINNENRQARQYVIDSAVYWMREFGVDGFRLDYANGPSHDFWTDYFKAVKAARPDSLHFGEIVETPALIRSYEGVMDGALDFNGLQMVRKAFAFGTATVEQFEQFLSGHEQFFAGRNFVLPSFLDNHDMNRFLWAARGDKRKLKLAAVCQFTLAAPPVIYYGTEVGLSQQRDVRQGSFGIPEESRQPMIWGAEQDRDLFAFYQRLIVMRRESRAVRSIHRQAYIVEPETGRYGYFRIAKDERVLVLLNVAETAHRFDLPDGLWQDLLSGVTESGAVELDAFGYRVLRHS